jgi:hypothetical protein
MTTTAARVRTLHGARYIRQLCKHWAHKLEVEQVGDEGIVRFERGTATMTASGDDLTVTIDAEDDATAGQLKDVVARHLDRFAFREAPLPFQWS